MARVVVQEFERVVVMVAGSPTRVLGPGVHRFRRRRRTEVVRVDVRPDLLKIAGQEILTADGVAVRASLVVHYSITDPARWTLATTATASGSELLHLAGQMAARDLIGGVSAEELLAVRATAGAALTAAVESSASDVGARVIAVHLRDLTFPGELKATFAQVAAAKQETAAALARAHGETARLRALANAARLLDGNPGLRDLRTLQTVERSSATVVLHTAQTSPTGSTTEEGSRCAAPQVCADAGQASTTT